MTKPAAALVLLLAACSPAAEQPPANRSEAPAAVEEAAAVPPLAGEWSVTGINGGPVEQVYAMGASAGDGRLTIHSDCVRMAWDYRQERNIVAFTPASAAGCDRVRTSDEDRVDRAIGLANIAIFSNQGAEVQLSGAGGSVTLSRR